MRASRCTKRRSQRLRRQLRATGGVIRPTYGGWLISGCVIEGRPIPTHPCRRYFFACAGRSAQEVPVPVREIGVQDAH